MKALFLICLLKFDARKVWKDSYFTTHSERQSKKFSTVKNALLYTVKKIIKILLRHPQPKISVGKCRNKFAQFSNN